MSNPFFDHPILVARTWPQRPSPFHRGGLSPSRPRRHGRGENHEELLDSQRETVRHVRTLAFTEFCDVYTISADFAAKAAQQF
jgi:hypothetical protein